MIRYLTEPVPVMICPRWVHTRIQPIAAGNVVDGVLLPVRLAKRWFDPRRFERDPRALTFSMVEQSLAFGSIPAFGSTSNLL